MAEGNQLSCHSICKNFTWTMCGKVFQADVMLIPLGSCDIVLGVQWLSTLGAISWDFKKLLMKFILGGEEIHLKGVSSRRVRVVNKEPSVKMLEQAAQLCLLQVMSEENTSLLQMQGANLHTSIPQQLQQLQQRFVVVFEEP